MATEEDFRYSSDLCDIPVQNSDLTMVSAGSRTGMKVTKLRLSVLWWLLVKLQLRFCLELNQYKMS